MQDLARRMMTLSQAAYQPGARLRFSAAQASDAEIKIALLPCLSDSDPEAAMGLMAVLALWLENWQSVVVYRVFARFDDPRIKWDDPRRWQFSFDDLPEESEYDTLDDNVGLWGTLNRDDDGGFTLRLELESDLDESQDKILSYKGISLRDLFSQIPAIGADIGAALGLDPVRLDVGFAGSQLTGDGMHGLLVSAFRWELTLLRWLADDQPQITPAHAALVDVSARHPDLAGAWVVARLTERGYLAGFEPIHDRLLEPQAIAERLSQATSTLVLAQVMFDQGRFSEAVSALDALIDDAIIEGRQLTATQSALVVNAYITLAGFYLQSERLNDGIETLQEALTEPVVTKSGNPWLLSRLNALYAQALIALNNRQGRLDESVLSDPSGRTGGEMILWEALAAYRQAEKAEAEGQGDQKRRAGYLASQVLLLLRMNDISRDFWRTFEALINADEQGELTRGVVDEFYALEDVSPAIDLLERAIRIMPDRHGLYLALASVCITDEDEERALLVLDQMREAAGEAWAADIDRLTLIAEDPEFEVRLGEMTDKISNDNPLTDDEIEYLEDAVDRAPYFSEGYVLLGQAYLLLEDASAALEALLDAHKHLPDDPEVIEWLAKTLWEQEQEEIALRYLKQGLDARQNANNVPLLALAGQYAFELGEDDTARRLLARAEAISPRHPALSRAKEHISRLTR